MQARRVGNGRVHCDWLLMFSNPEDAWLQLWSQATLDAESAPSPCHPHCSPGVTGYRAPAMLVPLHLEADLSG